MPRRTRTKRPPFVTLPRHKRGNAVIRLKGEMRRNADMYGGKFTSHLVLEEGRETSWFDFLFPGQDKFVLWNATIVTAAREFWEDVSTVAYDKVDAEMKALGIDDRGVPTFEPASQSATGKVMSYRMVHNQPKYEEFAGRTFTEQWQHVEQDVVRNDPPPVYEQFVLDRQYVYGIGLHMVMDADTITRDVIEDAIARFVANGEKAWKADQPIPRERLPDITEDEALAQKKSFLPALPMR